MKRLSIVSKTIATSDLADIDTDSFTNRWQLKAERIRVQQQRKFKNQMV